MAICGQVTASVKVNCPHDLPHRVRDIRGMVARELVTRIEKALADAGLSERKACLRAGLNVDAIRNIRRGREPRVETLRSLARALKVDPGWLLQASDHDGADIDRMSDEVVSFDGNLGDLSVPPELPSGFVPIPELEARAAAGGGFVIDRETVRFYHPFAQPFIQHQLRADPDRLAVVEVDGDSMNPTLLTGDRVIVDMGRTLPSPPGIFALFDGLGVVVKRVEHIHGSDPPVVRIISDNPMHAPYERTIEEARILGRVVWVARRI